jgi:hypothetical protein
MSAKELAGRVQASSLPLPTCSESFALWPRSLEKRNAGAFARNIYINGTPVERLIGRPASHGCIRMRSREVVVLFSSINVGAKITVK